MSTSTPSAYKRLNQGAARMMFIMGLGLFAVIVGSVLSIGLSMRLGPRFHGAPFALRFAVDLLLRNLWCLLILPVFVHAAARVVELRLWTTALGSLLTGSAFVLTLTYLQRGAGEVWRGAGELIGWLVVLGLSTLAIRWALVKAGHHREAQVQRAQAQAAAKVSEYDVFRAQAEALGDRHAARAAEGGQLAASVTLAASGTDGGSVSSAPDDAAGDGEGAAPGLKAVPTPEGEEGTSPARETPGTIAADAEATAPAEADAGDASRGNHAGGEAVKADVTAEPEAAPASDPGSSSTS